ncbi:MAG TPA: hypothetical protein PK201_05975 [Accumulibacter sp.]|nr:hypothetical protein [Accumulibacter sp.]
MNRVIVGSMRSSMVGEEVDSAAALNNFAKHGKATAAARLSRIIRLSIEARRVARADKRSLQSASDRSPSQPRKIPPVPRSVTLDAIRHWPASPNWRLQRIVLDPVNGRVTYFAAWSSAFSLSCT